MNFKEQLDRKRQAAKSGPQSKPVGEMSEAELDRAIEEKQAEIRQIKERELVAARETAAASITRPKFLANKRRRPSWR